MSNDSANKRIAKNSMLLSIQMVFVLILTLYTTRVVLQILGIEDYGVYNVVCGFVSMFTFLCTSMSNGIQRFFNFELGKNGEEGACKVFNTALIIQAIFALLIIILSETLGLWYLYEKMVIPDGRFDAAFWIFQFSIISFLFIIFQAPFTAAVMAHEKMSFYAVICVTDAILKLAIVFVLPLIGSDKLIVYGFLFTIISIFNFTVYLIYCKRNFNEVKIRSKIYSDIFKSLLGFSGWNIFGAFANMMREQGINLILNFFFGPIVNAARGVASQVNGGLQAFVANLTTAIRPQVVQSYAQGDYTRTMRLTFSISKMSCFCLYIIALPVLLDIDLILDTWLGGNVPEHTSSFVYIIVLTSFLNNLNAAVSGVVHASGKMKLYQLTGSLCMLLSLPLSYATLKMGAAPEWALIICFLTMILTQIVALFVLKTIVEFTIKDYILKVLRPFFTVVILSFWIPSLIHCHMEVGIIRFITVSSTSIITTAIAVYFLGLDKSEKALITPIIYKVIRRNR